MLQVGDLPQEDVPPARTPESVHTSHTSNRSIMTAATRSIETAGSRSIETASRSLETGGSYQTAFSNTNSIFTKSSHPDSLVLGEAVSKLGIQPDEDDEFGWIAEISMKAELPPGWTSRTDESGVVHYVDNDTLSCTFDNPLTPYLKQIVDIGRLYLDSPSEGFFHEQKTALWQMHRAELDFWYGPLQDDEGNYYYVSSKDGISSWQDPRQTRAYIYDLQCVLLGHLQTILAAEDPGFFGGGTPWENEDGAQILTLESFQDRRKGSKSSLSSSLSRIRLGQEDHTFALQQMQRMETTAEWIDSTVHTDEEAQRNRMIQRVEERRMRNMSRKWSKSVCDSQPLTQRSLDTLVLDHVIYPRPPSPLDSPEPPPPMSCDGIAEHPASPSVHSDEGPDDEPQVPATRPDKALDEPQSPRASSGEAPDEEPEPQINELNDPLVLRSNEALVEEPQMTTGSNEPLVGEPPLPPGSHEPFLGEPLLPPASHEAPLAEPLLPLGSHDPMGYPLLPARPAQTLPVGALQPLLPPGSNDSLAGEPLLPLGSNEPVVEPMPLTARSEHGPDEEPPLPSVRSNDVQELKLPRVERQVYVEEF